MTNPRHTKTTAALLLLTVSCSTKDHTQLPSRLTMPEAVLVVGHTPASQGTVPIPTRPGGFDVGEHTKNTLQGMQKLLTELDGLTPPGSKVRGLKLRLGVLMAYLATVTSRLSPEEQAEVRELAKELFELVSKNPKSDM